MCELPNGTIHFAHSTPRAEIYDVLAEVGAYSLSKRPLVFGYDLPISAAQRGSLLHGHPRMHEIKAVGLVRILWPYASAVVEGDVEFLRVYNGSHPLRLTMYGHLVSLCFLEQSEEQRAAQSGFAAQLQEAVYARGLDQRL